MEHIEGLEKTLEEHMQNNVDGKYKRNVFSFHGISEGEAKVEEPDNVGKNYNNNLRTDTREKALECHINCKLNEYDVSKESSQKSHMVQSSCTDCTDKPFKCNICPKSFSVNYCLTEHSHIHFDEKSFKCNLCSKTFAQKYQILLNTSCINISILTTMRTH